MDSLDDPVFGRLLMERGDWLRQYEISIFGEERLVRLVVRAHEKPTDEQRATFTHFERNKDACVTEIEKAIFDHYEAIVEDKRGDLEDLADEMMPVITSRGDLKDLVTLEEILVQHWDPPNDKEIGFLFDCSWDPGHGLGVKLSDNKVTEVDTQDILL